MYRKIRQLFSKHVLYVAIVMLVIAPISLVVTQYLEMRVAIEKLLEYQNDYRSYAMTLKRVIREKTKNNSEDSKAELKKKIIISESENVFNSAAEVFSSDCDEPLFRVVNRDIKRLNQNALLFARKHQVEADMLRLLQEKKQGVVLQKVQKKQPVKKRKRRRKKTTGAMIQSIPFHLASMMVEESDAGGKHDFECHWPLKKGSYRMSSGFGPRKIARRGWRFHPGLDLAACSGTPVYAASSGTVVQSGWYKGYGNCITIAHGKRYKTRYGHLKKTHVHVGSKVQVGTLIGQVGNTGNVVGKNGFHLHFEIHSFGKPVNPVPLLKN